MMISALGSEKRNSIIKTALNDNGKSSLTYRLSDELMTPPIKSKSTTSCGQLFLCMIGSLLSGGICIWLAFFSNDVQWRRMVFATGSALCAIMFGFLAITSIKRRAHTPPIIEQTLIQRRSISQRRSTRGPRDSRGSVGSANAEISTTDNPKQVLVMPKIKKDSASIA